MFLLLLFDNNEGIDFLLLCINFVFLILFFSHTLFASYLLLKQE